MAIERVSATLNREEKDMGNIGHSTYETKFNAPLNSGDYSIEIRAYDNSGNVGIANAKTNPNLLLRVSKWRTPKTNWKISDRFNFEDYNRIKNNIEYLHEESSDLWRSFEIENMGNDVLNYVTEWEVNYFNAWEKNIEIINKIILTKNYGASQTFYENGVFIQWNELNRIESAILSMQGILCRQKQGLKKLSFRLGDFKGVKI